MNAFQSPGVNLVRFANAGLPARARGSALLAVVVFLLLASLFVLFALNVGRFEQRTSGNDVRAKIAQELAEAGVHQGVEYFNANRDTVVRDPLSWEDCSKAANPTDFPCGAVPAARHGNVQRFIGGIGANGLQVDLPVKMNQAGGYAASQQVGAVICRIKRQVAPGPPECTTDLSQASSTWLLTVVSKGALTGEGATSTVSQTIGAYSIFAVDSAIPPVVAAGPVTVGGGIQVIAAPNAAGVGLPVSVWTRLAMTKAGTPNTCYLDEFLREGGSSSGPAYFDGIMVCHTCKCPAGGSLSFPQAGNQACQGMDIVDIDGNTANSPGCPLAPNLDIKRSEFPKDLFAFVFGQKAWDDIDQGSGGDTTANREFNFAEQRRISTCNYPAPGTGAPVSAVLPEDTCYLLNIKNKVHIGDGINDAAECNAIGPASRGIIWVHSQAIPGHAGANTFPGYDCVTKLRNVNDIGTPSKPVALIFDGVLTQVHFRLYGLLFVRSPNGTVKLDKDTGGDAELGLNGGATIYGAAIVQGTVSSGGGGTAVIVYNKDVLDNLITDRENESPTSLPGSWTDRLRY